MVSINTNLSSLLVQNNLAQSTNSLSKAVERLTTGYKINHASDNAAGYSIAQDMTSKLSSYDVAADNISMGLDLLSVAQTTISQMQSRGERLMALWTQAQNGTYGPTSLSAINQEATAIMQEINRLYMNTEYNGINLFNNIQLPDWAQSLKDSQEQGIAEYNGFIEEAHHIDDAEVNAMTHVSELDNFVSGETYAITSVDDLVKLASLVNAGNDSTNVTFVMGADLDISAYCAENTDASGNGGWNPIGTSAKQFKGTFDGNGHKIDGLYIKRETSDYQGLFGCVRDATVKNIGLENAKVVGKNDVGILAGNIDEYYSAVDSCYSTGTVDGDCNVGGLIGSIRANSGYITLSYTDADINGKQWVGGLAGHAICDVDYCHSSGKVNGDCSVGGLFGNYIGSISDCYSYCNVSGARNVGGFIGYNEEDDISVYYCVSFGDVNGKNDTGGFIGRLDFDDNQNIELFHVGAFGKLSGEKETGSIVGKVLYGPEGCLDLSKSEYLSQAGFDIIGWATQVNDAIYDNVININDITVLCLPTTTLQVGVNGDSSSQIEFGTDIRLNLNIFDISSARTYDTISDFLSQLSDKATELGATSNRLESALESTTVAMENLTSSLSTIKDADIAKVSSEYIKKQILQQASATLLATANQSPSIALQLL